MELREILQKIRRSPRNPRLSLLQRMPKKAICAEIGVWQGDFSRLILRHTDPARLYLVDCWEYQPEFASEASHQVAKDQADYDAMHAAVKKRFAGHKNVKIIRDYSADAIRKFANEYFDWIYIDGNHLYEFVKKDLELCCPKVKVGGYIVGDDYHWGRQHGYPVKQAVDEFVASGRARLIELLGSQFILRKHFPGRA